MVSERLALLKEKQTPKVRKPLAMPDSLPRTLKSLSPPPFVDDESENERMFAERRKSRRKVQEWEAKKKKLQPRKKGINPEPIAEKAEQISRGTAWMVMLAMSKFKVGGLTSHARWELGKEEERKKKLARKVLRQSQQMQQEETLLAEFEDEARHNKIGVALGKEKLAFEKLMAETKVRGDASPVRVDSATQKFIQGEGTVRPNSAEAWNLGLDVLKLRDKLNAIGPGAADPATLVPRAHSYPTQLPRMADEEIQKMLDEEVISNLTQKLNDEKRQRFQEKSQRSIFDLTLQSMKTSKTNEKLRSNAKKMAATTGKKTFRGMLNM